MYGINRFPERLKFAMEKASIPSNNQLARMTDLSEATIRKYLKGDTYPTLDRLALIADACSCSFAWLASGEGEEPDISVKVTEKFENKNEMGWVEFEQILTHLTEEQRKKLLKVIYTKGVSTILKLDDDFDSRLMTLSEDEKLRLLNLHEEIKKGALERSEEVIQGSLATKKRKAG